MATVLGSKRKEEQGTSSYSTASFPLGFKFSPTDEQLIDHYLRLKNEGRESEVQIIAEVDFYDYEPWDLPELSVIKSDQREWFFFRRRDAVLDLHLFNLDRKDEKPLWSPLGQRLGGQYMRIPAFCRGWHMMLTAPRKQMSLSSPRSNILVISAIRAAKLLAIRSAKMTLISFRLTPSNWYGPPPQGTGKAPVRTAPSGLAGRPVTA
ncbi:hypothetical protein SLA2020_420440 [Shorea laevis]